MRPVAALLRSIACGKGKTLFFTWKIWFTSDATSSEIMSYGTAAANRPIFEPPENTWVNMEQRGINIDWNRRKYLSQCHFVYQKSHIDCPGVRDEKSATNRLSYGAAQHPFFGYKRALEALVVIKFVSGFRGLKQKTRHFN
jgi:hypothetical protein